MNLISSLITCIIAASAIPVETTTKTWKYSNDVLNPLNWVGEKASSNGEAVVFPSDLGSLASVSQLYANELILPENGEIEIKNGGFIQIGPNASNIAFELKELKPRRWLDPLNWKYRPNAAIPDVEKTPCSYDDVVFSPEGTVAVILPETPLSVKSVSVDGLSLTDSMWDDFLETDYGNEQFFISEFGRTKISIGGNSECPKSGCLCHETNTAQDWFCSVLEKIEPPCYEPIEVAGNCNKVCGGLVLLKIERNFDLDRLIREIPEEDGIDFYASRIDDNTVQVVFAEHDGEYKELSTASAKKLHDIVTKDLERFRVKSAKLKRAGIALPKGSAAKAAFSIIFATFAAVAIVYTLLYVKFMGPLKDYNLRVPFLDVVGLNFNARLFSNLDDDRTSLTEAETLVSTERSFDNPMYEGGSQEVTEMSTVTDANPNENQPASNTDSEHQPSSVSEHVNPLFNENDRVEIVIEQVEHVNPMFEEVDLEELIQIEDHSSTETD